MVGTYTHRYWRLALAGTACAVLAFWSPSLLLHALSPDFGTLGEPLFLTLAAPLLVSCAIKASGMSRRLLAATTLASLWILGPTCMMISASFAGGGFRTEGAWWMLAVATAAFPVFTFLMSAYHGTIFAVLATTILLGIRIVRRDDTAHPSPV